VVSGNSAGGAKAQASAGGLRVIYFVRYHPSEFWMLALYAKAKQENAPAHILKRLKEEFERGQETHRPRARSIRGGP